MNNKLKICTGTILSVAFMFLALHKVNFYQMVKSIKNANYLILSVVLGVVIFSAWLRSLRWKFFLFPIKNIAVNSLFSSLLIGYAINFLLPAHLGELARAYIVGKKHNFSPSSAFATIVTERIIDMITLLLLMIITLLIYPFPEWVKKSGYLIFTITVAAISFLITLKLKTEKTKKVISFLLRPFPQKINFKILNFLTLFVEGFVSLNNWKHYVIIFLLSIFIWVGYALVFWLSLIAFGFQLPWIAPFVLMIVTTISIVVPSSPGYIGTYHLLCQLSLSFFGIAKSTALGFAFVIHGLNTIPFLVIGLALAWKEGINISKMSKTQKFDQLAIDSNKKCPDF